MERGFLSLKYLDSEWHKTAEGDLCIQQLHNQHEMSRKQFGLLEHPNFSPGTHEITYKIAMLGKSGSGKTKSVSLLSGKPFYSITSYTETVGIHIKDVYWPSRISGKMCVFKLQFWESGESSAKKYAYISPACTDKADALAVVINKADKSSFEFAEVKLDSVSTDCASILIFVIDSDQEIEVSDEDLNEFARRKRLPIFHLPPHALNIKYLAPFYNSLCDFLYSTSQHGGSSLGSFSGNN